MSLTAQFIEEHVMSIGLVANGFNVSDCTILQATPDTESSGLFLEGVAIIADLTQNQTWVSWYVVGINNLALLRTHGYPGGII